MTPASDAETAFEEEDSHGQDAPANEEEGEEEEGEEEEGEAEASEAGEEAAGELPVPEELKEPLECMKQRMAVHEFCPEGGKVTQPFVEVDGLHATFVIADGL